ncbi:DUF6528 family protein [Actinoplanes sp. NPDC024001]|uniref:DUF6528 family protein n=1 Tax=Actinoplanes sp. NPDC024001 TaxID=3154598 RepID=UPI0033DF69EA
MRKTPWKIGSLLAVALCVAAQGAVPAAAAAGDFLLLGGDQKNHKIYVLDPAVTDWNSASAVKWEWAPTTARGFSSTEASGFVGGNDFRLRNTDAGQRMVIVDGAGLLTVIGYPSGNRVWAQKSPAADNRHSAELLPDGNVAVAASTGGYVRVYAASQGANATAYAQFALEGAHATLWDPQINRLWVAGEDRRTDANGAEVIYSVLTALEVTGPPSAPSLREDRSRRQELGTLWAHDVSHYHYDTSKLWVTTNARTYLYDKNTRTFAAAGEAWDRRFVKAVGNQPSGQVVQTMPDVQKNPQGGCYLNNTANLRNWCTDTVDFFGPDTRRTRTSAAFYKVRVMNPNYSANDQNLRGKLWERTRAADGTWAGAAALIDGNQSIKQVAATPAADGRLHVVTLLPDSGLWFRTREANGDWADSAVKIDDNGDIADVAIAASPDGTLHVFGLVPGSGVWYRTRSAAGVWAGSATKIDENGSISDIAATVNPAQKTVHFLGLVPGSGIWHKTRSAAGAWTGAEKIDTNGDLADIAAAALPDGTVHSFGVTAWGGVYHRTRTSAGAWQSSVQVPADGSANRVIDLAATGWPATKLDLVTVRAGSGLWAQTNTGSGWPAATRFEADPSALRAYAAHLTDGTLHAGRIAEIS